MTARLLAFLGTALLVAAAIAAGLWAREVVEAQPALPRSAAVEIQSAPDNAAPRRTARPRRPDIYYIAITERPVFAPDRRPMALAPATAPEPEPEPVVSAPEPERPDPPQLRLLGVMGNSGGNRALISRDGGDPTWITPGATLDGWTIAEIGPDWLSLTHKSETIRVEMYQQ